MGKYKFVNGVMVNTEEQKAPSAPPKLEIITNQDDLMEACGDYKMAYNSDMKIPEPTANALEHCSNDDLDRLGLLFGIYEVPIGLLPRLLALKNYDIQIILDDSGSMCANTDSKVKDLYSMYMQTVMSGFNPDSRLTRWNEEEDRLFLMLQFLTQIDTGKITISFMNRSDTFVINGKENKNDASINERIHKVFMSGPSGGTPTLKCMRKALEPHAKPTIIYLMTDGVPSDTSVEELAKYLEKRPDPKNSPLTLISCTDKDEEAEWMKELEEYGPFISELDDFNDEKEEVIHDQGQGFPYSFGLYLMCMLVGAINPDDLDALDDSRPITKFTLNDIMGRELTNEEYLLYWNSHPRRSEFETKYSDFRDSKVPTTKLVGKDTNTPMKKLGALFKKKLF
jgi:hypothetical protein